MPKALRGVAILILLAAPAVPAQARHPDVSQIPAAVLQALRAKFPGAEIQTWTREQEGGVVLYDLEFTQQGRKFEADIKEDGSIHNWEREVASQDLPEAVRRAIRTKYSTATVTLVMEITAVQDGKDILEGYEILLRTAAGREVEVTVAPDGTILEEDAP